MAISDAAALEHEYDSERLQCIVGMQNDESKMFQEQRTNDERNSDLFVRK